MIFPGFRLDELNSNFFLPYVFVPHRQQEATWMCSVTPAAVVALLGLHRAAVNAQHHKQVEL